MWNLNTIKIYSDWKNRENMICVGPGNPDSESQIPCAFSCRSLLPSHFINMGVGKGPGTRKGSVRNAQGVEGSRRHVTWKQKGDYWVRKGKRWRVQQGVGETCGKKLHPGGGTAIFLSPHEVTTTNQSSPWGNNEFIRVTDQAQFWGQWQEHRWPHKNLTGQPVPSLCTLTSPQIQKHGTDRAKLHEIAWQEWLDTPLRGQWPFSVGERESASTAVVIFSSRQALLHSWRWGLFGSWRSCYAMRIHQDKAYKDTWSWNPLSCTLI